MDQKLTGRVALITGASAGIGAALARLLAAQGAPSGFVSTSLDESIAFGFAEPPVVAHRAKPDARLVLTARREDRLHALVQECAAEALVVTGDAREEATAQRVVDGAMERLRADRYPRQ